MKNVMKSQRGGALVYVLFAVVLLALLTPPLLNMLMSRFTSDKALGNQLAANQLASSSMESFFSYLNASNANGITANTWNGYISNFAGWTPIAGVAITLPDGKEVTYSQVFCTNIDCSSILNVLPTSPLLAEIDTELEEYYVRIQVVAGDTDRDMQPNEQYAKKAELVKAVPIKRKGAAVIIDPETPGGGNMCVVPGGSGVIVGGSTTASAFMNVAFNAASESSKTKKCAGAGDSGSSNVAAFMNLGFTTATASAQTEQIWRMPVGGINSITSFMNVGFTAVDPVSPIGEVIGSFLNQQKMKVQTLLTEVTSKAESCEAWKGVSNCQVSDITSMYNNRKAQGIKPIYIKAKQLSGIASLNIGSLDNPLILIVDQVTASSLGGTLTGSLFVTGTLGSDAIMTHYSLQLNQGKNEEGVMDYGSLYVMGAAKQDGGGSSIIAQGVLFYGDTCSYTNGSVTMEAKMITVVNEFSVTSGKFNITTNGGPASFGSLDVSKSPTDISAANGDLFIENNFTGSNVKQVLVGGVVAVGGDLVGVSTSSITAGGTGSSLYMPGYTAPCS